MAIYMLKNLMMCVFVGWICIQNLNRHFWYISGAEVAQYCAANLPQYIKETKSYKEGRFNEALEEAFLGFDAILTTPKIVQELKVLAGVESDDEG